MMFFLRLSSLLALVLGAVATLSGADLFGGFGPGWRERWREERFFTTATRYEIDRAEGRPVLHATSRNAHAALLRPFDVAAPTAARLAWRWKVRAPLAARAAERTRAGDDYAARIFVVFEPSAFPLRTRAINYVWAAVEPVGAVFPSPYTKNVAMIVVRSGAPEAGRWLAESRDVLADYRQFFGREPERISAVAVLVDTDNTGLSAEAWFADLSLETTPPPRP